MGTMDSMCDGFADVTLPGRTRNDVGHGKGFRIQKQKSNVFAWQHMRTNLPGDPVYDPTLPWVFKAKSDASLAADVHMYVDNIR
jgi:hypothetical protein